LGLPVVDKRAVVSCMLLSADKSDGEQVTACPRAAFTGGKSVGSSGSGVRYEYVARGRDAKPRQ
jgi:hypothetical protein